MRKLGIKRGHRVWLVNAPDHYLATLGVLPEGVRVLRAPRDPVDLVQCFAADREALEHGFPRWKRSIVENGMIWACWPKKASGVVTDVDANVVRDVGLANGLVDVKVAAIDERWSGLKFVYRLSDRGSPLRR